MTRDEMAVIAIASGYIVVNTDDGNVFATRGPGGRRYEEPVKLNGSIVNGYRVYSIHVDGVKKQIRANRLVWIAAHGAIPDGMIIDHINNDKLDNRLCNLQLLTPMENSTKAKRDGLYLSGDNSPTSKISEYDRRVISLLYWRTDFTMLEIAKMYGISESRVQQLVHQYAWCNNLEYKIFDAENFAMEVK